MHKVVVCPQIFKYKIVILIIIFALLAYFFGRHSQNWLCAFFMMQMLYCVAHCIYLLVFALLTKKTYLSEILFFKNFIQLVYKKPMSSKIAETKKIFKDNIKLFELTMYSDIVSCQSSSACKPSVIKIQPLVDIYLFEGKTISFNLKPDYTKPFCTYYPVLKIIEVSQSIPNFYLNLSGNYSGVIENIQYFAKHKKQLSLIKRYINAPIYYHFVLFVIMFDLLLFIFMIKY